MRKNNRLPIGFQDTIGDDVVLENKVLEKFERIFSDYDYQLVKPSIIDYVENLQMESSSQDSLFKTIDNDGKLLAIINDITPAIVRLFEDETAPQRVFYNTKGYSFRSDEDNNRERYNVGAQIYNITGVEAEVELLHTIIQSLEVIGINNVKVVINNLGIIKNLVTSFNPNINITTNQILEDIKNKDNKRLGDVCLNMVTSIYNSKGGLETLEKVAESINNREALEGVVVLFRIYQLLGEINEEIEVEFDFGFFNGDKSYYNGTIFRVEGQDLVLASGGRYSGMKYGKGFTGVSCNYNMLILLEYNKQINKNKVLKEKILLAVEDSTEALVKFYSIRKTLNVQNICVVPLYKADRKSYKNYAQLQGIQNIIYIDSKGEVSE